MGFKGSPFTQKRKKLHERLDRLIANLSWRVEFPKAILYHLNLLKSDHCTILMRLFLARNSQRCRRLFQFESTQLAYNQFLEVVREVWNDKDVWNQHVNHDQESFMEWNTNIFGNIFKTKKISYEKVIGNIS